jgi:DNA polymerase-3 subunit epsilon
VNETPEHGAVREPALEEVVHWEPGAGVESWRLRVPGKGACYAMEDESGRVVLLGTTANLRNVMVAKLGPATAGEPTRKIDYAAIVRRVKYGLVYSRFEANWVYLENARKLLGGSYRRLIRHWRAYWVAVDLREKHPRFIAADRPVGPMETCFGPLPDSKSARRYVELIEDLFDLCRYHNILTAEPRGVACAYKQMARCGAPCDGSITMEAYREQLAAACRFVTEPRGLFAQRLTAEMKAAAGEHRFERAAMLKRQLDRAKAAGQPGETRIAPLSHFRFLALQRGSKKGAVRVFAIAPGVIEFVGEIEAKGIEETAAALAERVKPILEGPTSAMGRAESERVALVGWQLFSDESKRGVFLPWREVEAGRIVAAVKSLTTAKEQESAETVGETEMAE